MSPNFFYLIFLFTMKQYFVRSASVLAFALFCGVCAAAAQDIPTISLSVPDFDQAGAPANGAQRLSPNTLLVRERARTILSGNSALESGSIRISRSTSGSLAPISINYSLEYFSSTNAFSSTLGYRLNPRTFVSLPNIGSTVIGLPRPIVLPSPFTSPITTPPPPPPTPTVINGLQGDLAPNTILGQAQSNINATTTTPGTLAWGNGVSSQFINFRARFSDQQWYPRDPGKQGPRVAVFRLLPSPSYLVQAGADSAFVILDDPRRTPPIVMNSLPDIVMARPRGTNLPTEHVIELESPQFRFGNVPGVVLYDDNYDVLQYTATSEDATQVSVRIVPSNLYPGITQKTLLICSVQPGADTSKPWRVTVRAIGDEAQDDGERRAATDDFSIFIRGNLSFPTSVAETRTNALPSITTSPNPVTDKCLVSATIPDAGFFTLRVSDVLGTVVYNASVQGARGSEQQHTIDMTGFTTGTYFVEVNNGAQTSSRKIVKR
jgi:hypothetical protein